MIEDYAFAECTGLTGHVLLPESVTTIGTEPFPNTDKLIYVAPQGSTAAKWLVDNQYKYTTPDQAGIEM